MKNIIFDIGNIIAYIDINEVINVVTDKEEDKKFIVDNVYNSPEWNKYDILDTGFISLEEMIDIISDRFNNTKDQLIRDFMYEFYKHFSVSTKMLNYITNLRNNGYKVYLLSNMSDHFYDAVKPSGLFDIVDGYVLSFMEHKVKPHTGIYKELINRYNLDINESVFVDDRLINCEAAESIGMKAINVLPNNYDDLVSKVNKVLE